MAGKMMKGYREGGKMYGKRGGGPSGAVMAGTGYKNYPSMKGGKDAYSGQASAGSKMSSGKKRASLRGMKPSSSGKSVGLGKYGDQLSGGLYGKT